MLPLKVRVACGKGRRTTNEQRAATLTRARAMLLPKLDWGLLPRSGLAWTALRRARGVIDRYADQVDAAVESARGLRKGASHYKRATGGNAYAGASNAST